jgi:hypothetical protein
MDSDGNTLVLLLWRPESRADKLEADIYRMVELYGVYLPICGHNSLCHVLSVSSRGG